MEDKGLNQHIRQALENPEIARVTIELEEVFGNSSNHNFIEIFRGLWNTIEYIDGLLVLDFFEWLPTADKAHQPFHSVQLITKERVKRIYFDGISIPSRLPFSRRMPPLSSL